MQAADPGRYVRVLLASGDRSLVARLAPALVEGGFAPHIMERAPSGAEYPLARALKAAIVDTAADDGFADFLLNSLLPLSYIPCLALTAARRPDQRVAALRAGALDVMARPINNAELVARLTAMLPARPANEPANALVFAGQALVFDVNNAIVTHGDDILPLTAQETALLGYLMQHRHRIVRYGEICAELGLAGDSEGLSALRQTVSRLRRKLADIAADVQLVATRGCGYQIRVTGPDVGRGLPD
jgi:two-component system OmpR family response regulator